MPVILPFLALAAIWLALKQSFRSLDGRLLGLLAAVLWGVLLVFFTETLSSLHWFSRTALAVSWGFSTAAAVVWAGLKWKKLSVGFLPWRFSMLETLHLLGIAGIASLTGAIAIIAAPNNWDSMVYHLGRAVHWLQNGSVDFYPTNILRQLYLPPWSEYLLAHLLALSGADYLTQLPQWLAMLGSVAGVSLLAKQLGARPSGQIFAAFVTATLPMGILQSTTTQNDYIVTFWLVCLAVLLLQANQEPRTGWFLAVGGALGLALLTKSTAYIYALPFMLYVGIKGLLRSGLHFWKPVLLITAVVVLLNLPHFSRNLSLFRHPLGPQEELSRYHNEPISLEGTLSNIIRNTSMYAGSVDPINRILDQAVTSLHGWMNIQVNDPRFTWSDNRFSVQSPRFHEDTTPSSLHLALVMVSFLILAVKRKKLPCQEFLWYGLLLLAGFLLFCGYLRWQTWHPRLHLPLLVLSIAWLGLLPEISKKWVMWAVSLALAVMVLPVFYFNPNKPLVADYNIFNLPRREVTLMRKNLVVPYIESVNTLLERDCHEVGLFIPNEEWEYPFWNLYAGSGQPYRIEHVNVGNLSAGIARAGFEPCAIIATVSTGEHFDLDGAVYDLTWSMEPVYVYTK